MCRRKKQFKQFMASVLSLTMALSLPITGTAASVDMGGAESGLASEAFTEPEAAKAEQSETVKEETISEEAAPEENVPEVSEEDADMQPADESGATEEEAAASEEGAEEKQPDETEQDAAESELPGEAAEGNAEENEASESETIDGASDNLQTEEADAGSSENTENGEFPAGAEEIPADGEVSGELTDNPDEMESELSETEEEKVDPEECTHSYRLQDDSYEATDTTGGYRHYICSDCDDEYSYETDPMVYTVNPKTGEAADNLKDAVNPYLPNYEFMPDNELHVFWSKEDSEWRVYAVGSHDTGLSGWCGPDITCWSAPVYDLSDWRFEAILRDTGRFFACDFNYDLQTDQAVLYAFPFFGNSEMNGTHLWTNGHSVPDAYFDTPFAEGDGVEGLDGRNLFDPSIYIHEDGTILATYDNSDGGTKHAQLAKVNADDRTKVEWTADIKMADGERNTNGFNPKHYEGSTIDLVEVDGHSFWVIQYSYKSNWDDENDYEKDVDGEKRWWPLVYVYSDPDMSIDELKDFEGWHWGGVIGDNGGFYRQDAATGEVADHETPVNCWGNNHGGLVYLNGEWFVSNHRHTSDAAGRQGYIEKVSVSYENGRLSISTPEYTSSIGESIDAFRTWPAYIACHLWPTVFSETHEQTFYIDTPLRGASDDYWSTIYSNPEYALHRSPVVGITDGAEVGFKYLNFGDTETNLSLSLLVSREEGYADGTVNVYIDAPSEAEGGKKIGSINVSAADIEAAGVSATSTDGAEWSLISGKMDAAVSGTHGVYFVFASGSEGNICKLDEFTFKAVAAEFPEEGNKPSEGEDNKPAEGDNNTDNTVTAPAVGTKLTKGQVTYKVTVSDAKNGTVEYVKTRSASSSVTISDTVTIDGITYKITSIAPNAFKDNKNLKTISIGKNITSIGEKAFYRCTKLTTVKGCAGVTSIGNMAFCKCEKLKTIASSSNGGKSNTITLAKVKTIGTKAFYGCKALKTVKLTSMALTKINASAFQGCTALVSVTVSSKKLQTIGSKAFYKCTSMSRFTSASTRLTNIGKQAFYGNKKLASVSLRTEKLTKNSVGSSAFKGIKSTCTFRVPSKKVTSYKSIFNARGAGKKIAVKKL